MNIEYVYLDPISLEPSENGLLYRKISTNVGSSLEAVSEKKVETVRIDDNTVIDITYNFDVNLGEYVEVSRTEREEPLLPEPIDELTSLKLALVELAEAYEREKTELQLAVAELTEIVTGGAE